ncbi:MAG TPA: GNAT family N-acetyltransferase [Allosphingosinicella sp.]|jgi:GNAT superfamily N-acetyltransferase
MTLEDPYRLVPLTMSGEEFGALSALMLRVFPRARHLTPRYLAWLYAQNPDGEAVAFSAFADDSLVGHLGGMALTARIEGEVRRGLLLLNSAVHADHRRRSLMSRLSEAIFAEGARRGFSFSISTGNRYSSKPLLTRYQPVGLLEARIGIGWPRRGDSAASPSFERLWSEQALSWRLANPERLYSIRRLGDGISVSAETGLPGIAALLYQGPGRAPPAESAGPRPLGVWLGRDPGIAWGRSAFLPIPERLRPSPLNLFFRDLTGGGFVPEAGRLVFQALDFDAY